MTVYVYMLIVGVAAFCLNSSSNEFKGSSGFIKSILTIGAGIGFISILAFTIYAVFKTIWWHPVIGLIIVGSVSPAISGILRMLPNIILDVLCLAGVIAGSYLMWTYF